MPKRYSLPTNTGYRPNLSLFPLFFVLLGLFLPKAMAYDPPVSSNETLVCNRADAAGMATTGPVSLNYASYYGQSINNLFHDVAIDAAGNIYATGSTISQGFDAVVVKFDASGNFLWESLLGGTDAENFNGNDIHDYGKITVDAAGNVYVTGITQSDNFPMASPFQGSRAGGIDVFVAKLDTDGNLLLSSYLGGAGDENFGGSGGIAVGGSGEIYVAGSTFSDGFFTTTGAYQTSFSGGAESDVFVVKIAADFSSVEGTYWGDEARDVVRDLEIAPDGTVWAVGYSDQSGLTLGGFEKEAIDVRDGIILGFDSALASLSNSTFYGGKFDDEINGLAIDASGNLHITGSTFSTNDFPKLAPFQGTYIGGEEAFAAKLNSSCQLVWSTFIAASQNESGSDVAVDPSGNVYVSGLTSSTNFPIHRTAQETYNTLTCESDAFVFKFNADGSRDWATYYGGWRTENPYGIVANSAGQVITVGRTESTDIPVTDNAYQAEAFTNGINAFISIFEIACPSAPIIIHSTENAFYYDQFWCNSYKRASSNYFQSDTCTLQLIAPPGYTNYSWTKNGSPVSGANDQIYSVRSPGSANSKPEYRAIIDTGNDCADASTSNARAINWVRPMCGFGGSFDPNELPHQANIEEGYSDVIICPSETVNTTLHSDGFCGAEYQWQKDFEDIPNATDPAYTVTEPGCYRVSIINSFTGCKVYSVTKRFLLIEEVLLNDYYFNQPESCNDQDSIIGCSSVFIKARIPTCERCDDSPRSGLIYTFYLNGNLHTSNTYGYVNTSDPGTYTVEVSNGNCTFRSTALVVAIRPTEKPVFVQPTVTPVCLQSQDSLTFMIQHPAIGDSARMRYDIPYPGSDITTYDSLIRIAKTDLVAGCLDVRLTTREGCTSRTIDIELHDTLTPLIDVNGSHCIPVQLRSKNISSCHLDSIFWYLEDSLVLDRNYDVSYTATLPGNYVMRVKNACGDFLSDTVYISGNFVEPLVSPAGPICLPASLSVAAPDSHVVINWYRNTAGNSCNTHVNNLIPNENDTDLIANLPGFYFATLRDTISGCVSICSNKVEIQRSVAGANISPSNDIYFCDGTGISNVTFNVSPASNSFTYQWYRNNNPIAGATSSSYTTNTEGVYRVFLENACDNAFTPVVSIFAVENPEVTINQPDTIYLCGPDTIRLDTNNDQPLIYQWYQNDTMVTDAIDSFFLAIEPGKYQVYGINNNTQCEDWSQEIYIINSTPIVASISSTPACNGPCTGTLTSMVSGGIPFSGGSYSYAWENGSSNANRTSVCVGPYRITITDGIGCSTILSGEIDAGFSLNPSIDSISCNTANDGSISIATSGGEMPFQFSWNNGDTTNQLTNLSPGIYSLTVSDDQNCSTTFSASLSEPGQIAIGLSPMDATCALSQDGAISATLSGGTPPYQLTWDSLVILDSMMLLAGSYSVTVTDKNGCTARSNTTVGAPTILQSQLTITNTLDCVNSTDGAITAAGSGGTPPYTFLWEDASTNPSRSGLSAATYLLTLTDANQCQITDQIDLHPADPFSFTVIDSTDLSCWESNDGSFTFQVTGGASPYTYVVNSAAAGDSIITNLASGTYSVFVEDANGCGTLAQNITLESPDSLAVSVSTSPATCPGVSNGIGDLMVSGGTAPYTYTWSNGFDQNRNDTLIAGTYTVTVADANGCSKNITFDIGQPSPLVTSFSLVHNLCQGHTEGAVVVHSTTGGIAPYTYFLDSAAVASSNQQLDQLAAGNYTLRTLDATGCEIENALVILEPQVLTIAIQLDREVTCAAGADAMLSTQAAGGTPPYSYHWEDASSNEDRMNLSAGVYKVTLTDQHNCSSMDSIQIMDAASIEFTIGNQENLTCYGADDGSLSIIPTGGTPPYSYLYNTILSNDSILVGLAENSYDLLVVDANNCQSDLQVVVITSPDSLSGTVTSVATQCTGSKDGVATILATGGSLPYEYLWSNGHTSAQCDTLSAGNYSVTITDDHWCEKIVSFFVAEALPLATDFSIKNNDCKNSNNAAVTIINTTGGTPPYTYFLDQNTVPPGSSQVLTNLAAGNYILRTVDSHNCEISESLVLSEPDALEADLSISKELTCFGGADGAINAVVSGGTSPYTYLWQDGTTMMNPGNLATGFFQVTITDAQNCTITDSITLQDGPFIELNIVEQKDVDCFGAENGSFVLSGFGGTAPYQYFVNSTETSNERFENLIPGDYSVYTEDANGCFSELEIITIGEPLLLQANATTTDVQCFGESNGVVQLDVVGGVGDYLYLWNNNSEVSQASDLVAGNYIVTITDGNACTTSVNFTVGSPAPLETLLSSEDNLCFEEEKGKIVLEGTSGGTWPYHYFFEEEIWTNPEVPLSLLGAGQYELLTVDAQGCQFLQNLEIKEPPLFALDLGADIQIPFGQNASLDLSISNGRGIPVMRISPTEFLDCQEEIVVLDCPNPEVILPTRNMLYTVELLDENGCVARDEIQILLDRTEDGIYLPNIFTPSGGGFNSVFYVQSNATIESVDRFIIMNRWGGMVFEQTDFMTNDTDYGWGGLVNGNRASEGVYVWMVEYRTIDGRVEQIVGDVLLKW